MSFTVAVAGKGGTGKTTVMALIIRHLLKNGAKSVLAIDADPNANLNQALGLPSSQSVADIIDDTKEKQMSGLPGGMSKDRYIEYRLQDCLIESKGVDLLMMGRPEGPGCYCYANALLRDHIGRLSRSYQYIVMDNEAGMEHLSRRTTRKADILLIVTDHSQVGLRSAFRIYDVAKELKLEIKKAGLVINRVHGEISTSILEEIKKKDLPLFGSIAYDEKIEEADLKGTSILNLPDDSPAVKAVDSLMSSLFKKVERNKVEQASSL